MLLPDCQLAKVMAGIGDKLFRVGPDTSLSLPLLSLPRRQRRGLRGLPSGHQWPIAVPFYSISSSEGLKLGNVIRSELHRQRPDVLVQVLDLGGAWNRAHVASLVVDPGQGQLRGGAALVLCHRMDSLKYQRVLTQISWLEPRDALHVGPVHPLEGKKNSELTTERSTNGNLQGELESIQGHEESEWSEKLKKNMDYDSRI